MLLNALHIFSIVCFLSLTTTEQRNKAAINYDEQHELNWEDYKAKPNKASSYKALTATVVSFSAKSDGKTLQLTLQNAFEPHNSWTKTIENKELLDHERLHFHISEVYARKLRKEILNTKFKSSGQKLMNEISELYQSKMNELAKYQRRYDKETDHSIDVKKQKEWERQVFQELEALKSYFSAEITIQL